MSEIILHHYELSPYAEKIRLVLGFKQLAWRSVQIPVIMPKPDLTALTGGYRKTPVLQIGADAYCDTKLIVRKLETLRPSPPLFNAVTSALERGIGVWSDALFFNVVTIFVGGPGEVFDDAFIEDREKLMPGGIDLNLARAVRPSKIAQLRANLAFLERQLAEGAPYLLGAQPGIADFSVYHPIRFLERSEATRPLLEALPGVRDWMARIAAVGHGMRMEISGADALRIARETTPAEIPSPAVDPQDPVAAYLGKSVSVLPEDYGRDPVAGSLVFASIDEIAVRRHDERVGDVVVHFPREDFLCFPAS
jgi:glutathione S-transferase